MEKWHRRWFEGKMPSEAKSLHEQIFATTSKAEALVIKDEYTTLLMEKFGFDREEAEREAGKDIGYLAGYGTSGMRYQIEDLFDVEHPVFGRIKDKGPPNVVDAFAAGYRLGQQKLEEN